MYLSMLLFDDIVFPFFDFIEYSYQYAFNHVMVTWICFTVIVTLNLILV